MNSLLDELRSVGFGHENGQRLSPYRGVVDRSVVASPRMREEITNVDTPLWPWVIAFLLVLAVSTADAEAPANVDNRSGITTSKLTTAELPQVSTIPERERGEEQVKGQEQGGRMQANDQTPGGQEHGMVQEQVIRDKLGNVVRTTVRTDGEASASDPTLEKLFGEASDFAQQFRAIQAADGLQVARAKGLELRTQLSSVCNFQLQEEENKDDVMKRRCAEARQNVERGLGELRGE